MGGTGEVDVYMVPELKRTRQMKFARHAGGGEDPDSNIVVSMSITRPSKLDGRAAADARHQRPLI